MSVRGIDARQQEEARRRSQRCVDEALSSASQLAAISLAMSGAFVYGLNRWSAAFRGKFNTSVKAAFVVMPAFYSFYLESERAVYRCHAEGANEHMNHGKLRALRRRQQQQQEEAGGGLEGQQAAAAGDAAPSSSTSPSAGSAAPR